MKFVGHTMATPNHEIVDAIDLFKNIGLDAIEIVSQPNTKFCIDDEDDKIADIIKKADVLPEGVITLTPYFWNIDHFDEKEQREQIEGLKKAIRLTKKMGGKFVRSYGGNLCFGDAEPRTDTFDLKWGRAVEALKECIPVAKENDVTILIENHPSTLTRTGRASYELVNAVGSDYIKTLYDPCNVLYDTSEDWEVTLDSQQDVIGYVHVKDYFMEGETRRACVVGEGIVPWDKIMKKLKYDGYFSFEYEKKWYPEDLEDPETGVLKCMNYMKGLVK